MASDQTLYTDGVLEAVLQYHFAAKVDYKPEQAEVCQARILQHASHPQPALPDFFAHRSLPAQVVMRAVVR